MRKTLLLPIAVLVVILANGCSGVKDAMLIPREGLSEEENQWRRDMWNPKYAFNPPAPPPGVDVPVVYTTEGTKALAQISQQTLEANQAAERAGGVVGIASHDFRDQYGNINNYTRATVNGVTTVQEQKTTYDGPWATTTTTTTTRRYR